MRSSQEIASRAVALFAIFSASNSGTDRVIAWLKEQDAWGMLSVSEQEFLVAVSPSRKSMVKAIWRMEGLSVLLWRLGLVSIPDDFTDLYDNSIVSDACSLFFMHDIDSFIKSATIQEDRSLEQLVQRLTDAYEQVANALEMGKMPPNEYNPSLIYERLYAALWLTGEDLDWDMGQ